MMRSNDIVKTCSECYVFDPTASTLNIIMARGSGITFSYHSTADEGNAAGYTLTEAEPTTTADPTKEPTTAAPTMMPTNAPTTAEPTNAPTMIPTIETQELFTTGFSVAISVGAESTTVDVVAPVDVWHGVGFGGLTMSAGTIASIYTGTDTLDTRWFEATGAGTSVGSFWTVSNYVADDTEVMYTMMRNNDITDICMDCYVFDATAATLDIIMARGQGVTSLSYHDTSGDGHAAGYTLIMPTSAPTTTDDSEESTTASPDGGNVSSAGKIQVGLVMVAGLFNFLWL